MSNTKTATENGGLARPTERRKRVVFTMGGKGGVGKTGCMLMLSEWFEANEIPFTLLDLDTENKARGSLKHYFDGAARKVDINTPAGLDAFIDYLEEGAPVILADMGSGSGRVTEEWFDKMYEQAAEDGIAFTAIGIITSDPASVESVLSWANRLQKRVSYLIVENASVPRADLSYWRDSEPARLFREVFQPAVITMEYRLPDIENPARQHGVTLGAVADRKTHVEELGKASFVMRAQSYRRRLFTEFEKAKELLLP